VVTNSSAPLAESIATLRWYEVVPAGELHVDAAPRLAHEVAPPHQPVEGDGGPTEQHEQGDERDSGQHGGDGVVLPDHTAQCMALAGPGARAHRLISRNRHQRVIRS